MSTKFKSDLEKGKEHYTGIIIDKWSCEKRRDLFPFMRGAFLFCSADINNDILFLMEIASELRLMEMEEELNELK